jgi:flagella basal body P-ring formation protein FlgA
VDGPSRWNVFLPITVRAWGPAWTIRQPVAPGATLTEADAELTEVDWAESIAPVLALPEDWMGSQATRALMPGQILRKGMVRTPQVFDAGTQVRVTVRGNGFQLAATGEALAHGYVGQPVRVRMPNRKILTGTVRDAETVEIAL